MAEAQSKKFTLIQKLPERMAALKKEGHKKWDTGNTIAMNEGSDEFNNGLITILKDLIRHHASTKFLKETEVDPYVKTLVSKLEFEKKLGNPLGIHNGTLASHEVPAGLSVELQTAIVILVQSIVEEEPSFDFEEWKKNWEIACREGD